MSMVILKGGVSVDPTALQLAWSLEGRGIRLLVNDRGELQAGPREQLTPADIEAIREVQHELVRIVQYVARGAA